MISSSSSHTHTRAHAQNHLPSFPFIPHSISLVFTFLFSRDIYYSSHPPFYINYNIVSLFISLSPSRRGNMLRGVFSPSGWRWLSISETFHLQFSSTYFCHLSQGSSTCQMNLSEVTVGVALHLMRPWCSAIGNSYAEGRCIAAFVETSACKRFEGSLHAACFHLLWDLFWINNKHENSITICSPFCHFKQDFLSVA